jgi:hypothetical protein
MSLTSSWRGGCSCHALVATPADDRRPAHASAPAATTHFTQYPLNLVPHSAVDDIIRHQFETVRPLPSPPRAACR